MYMLKKAGIIMQNTSTEVSQIEQFKKKLRDSLLKETSAYNTIKIAKDANVYAVGDKAELVYFIESGQVKLSKISLDGKECLLAIHSPGDVFGELCIGRLGTCLETATAMTDTKLKTILYTKFLEHLGKESLIEGFVQYLATRVAEQQQVIANLVTIDSEQRLGKTLLQLAKSIGKKTGGTLIELQISHEELSTMIGTTRPRVSLFMQRFRNLGLIAMTKDHFMIIYEQKLSDYLSKIA
jgi:CRP/FNR family cyclic AMP-dependent transcriptional regulator